MCRRAKNTPAAASNRRTSTIGTAIAAGETPDFDIAPIPTGEACASGAAEFVAGPLMLVALGAAPALAAPVLDVADAETGGMAAAGSPPLGEATGTPVTVAVEVSVGVVEVVESVA
jgi:hypothetical protein